MAVIIKEYKCIIFIAVQEILCIYRAWPGLSLGFCHYLF